MSKSAKVVLAEIDQYAIAHVSSDETSGLDDEIGTATVAEPLADKKSGWAMNVTPYAPLWTG